MNDQNTPSIRHSSQQSLRSLTAMLALLLGAATPHLVSATPASGEPPGGVDLEPYVDPATTVVEKCEQTVQTLRSNNSDLTDYAALMTGLEQDGIPPAEWQLCAGHFLRNPAQSGQAAAFLDRMGYTYQRFLRSDTLESDRRAQAKLHALHQVFLNRPPGMAPHVPVTEELFDDLRQALQKKRLGPFSTRYGEDLLLEFDLSQGRWRGQPLSTTVLDSLLGQKKEALLRRIVSRVPAVALRDEARRRIVRLHIADSPWPEVTTQAAEVEAAVLAQGHFAVSLAAHPLLRGHVLAQLTPVQLILAKQDLWRQVVSLQPGSQDGEKFTALPAFSLREALSLELQGLSHPVSVCAPDVELDVTPCLESTAIHIHEPMATLDSDGRVHFAENLPSATLVDWLRKQPDISLSIEVSGRMFMGLHWPITFALPESLDFASKAGLPGPDLDVRVEPLDAQRILLTIKPSGQSYLAVIERDLALQFSVVSHGGNGKPGNKGKSGEDGGAGEEGAPGGNIQVQVVCATDPCGTLPTLARKMVDSQGGGGGVGGSSDEGMRINTGGRGRRRSQQPQGKKGVHGASGAPGRIDVIQIKPN